MLENKIRNAERFIAVGIFSLGLYGCAGFSCRSEALREARNEFFNSDYCKAQTKKHGYCKRPFEYEFFSFKVE